MHEINLLPPSRRKRLRRQRIQETLHHFFRHVQTALFLALIITATVAGIIQTTIILSPNEGETELTSLVRQYQRSRQSILEKNDLVKEVRDIGANRIVWSDHVNDILNVLPPGTIIKEMKASNSPVELTFTGSSVNRNSLIILGTRLEGLSWAVSVRKPLENLLARDNPDYSFTIVVKTEGVEEEESQAAEEPTESAAR